MQVRTFFRIMADSLLLNNPIYRTIASLVKFCNEQRYYYQKELKFYPKRPLNNIQGNGVYQKKFIFDSKLKTGVDYK